MSAWEYGKGFQLLNPERWCMSQGSPDTELVWCLYVCVSVSMNLPIYLPIYGFLEAQWVKNPPAMQEILVQFVGQEDPLEKG